jgi:pimeloyl-ACP methyl ester carboxylesterase
LTALHVYDAEGFGALPTTVVLHGIGSGATAFGAMLARLRPHVRRLVAPDLPGHGFSGSPEDRVTPQALFESVRTAIDELVREPMVLIGNSLGGVLSIRYSAERPDRLRALVLCSPAGARIDEEEWRSVVRASGSVGGRSAALVARFTTGRPGTCPRSHPASATS